MIPARSLIPFTVTAAEHAGNYVNFTGTGFRNTTIVFTLAGTNFQIGTFGSNVSFFNQTYTYGINMTANLTSVTPTSITARVLFLSNATIGTNGWLVNVTTVDGGSSMSTDTVHGRQTCTDHYHDDAGERREDESCHLLDDRDELPARPGNTTVTLFNQTYW